MHQSVFDEFGCPSAESLASIEDFKGTPEEFVGAATALFRNGVVTVEQTTDSFGNEARQVSFATVGWSGCESVIAAIRNHTLFHTLFWQRSERGGLHVYEIPDRAWETPEIWGLGSPKPFIQWTVLIRDISTGEFTRTLRSPGRIRNMWTQADARAEMTHRVPGSARLAWREVTGWREAVPAALSEHPANDLTKMSS